METQIETTHLSDALLTEILARLPLRSISRFKSVCKTWKSTLESPYFRRLFVSVHRNSSSSWSLVSSSGFEEIIGFYGCKTWDLHKSLPLFTPRAFQHIPPFYMGKFYQETSSNGLVLIKEGSGNDCCVGNPVLQQWVKMPPPPDDSLMFGLVTRVDEDGVVLSFKVVSLASLQKSNDYISCVLSFFLYSSETGIWTWKQIHCPCQITNLSFMTLNGTIYFYYLYYKPGAFVAHDFYSESDHFRLVHYPGDNNPKFKRALTTSRGFVMYITTLAQKEETSLKVWKLTNDQYSWQLLWNIGIPVIGNYYLPMAMHPFDSGIVYLWSLENRHLVTCNLRTRRYKILIDGFTYNDDHEDCVTDQSACEKYMDEMWGSRSSDWDNKASIEVLFQFVLPLWMESMPCPPEVEMIDTTSLLSYTTSED